MYPPASALGAPTTLEDSLSPRLALSDEDLAALVRLDGEERAARAAPAPLSEYIRLIPRLRARPLVLDAAISASLGGVTVGSAHRAERAVHERSLHPALGAAIDLAVALDEMMCSHDLVRARARREASCHQDGLGPLLEDGRRRYAVRCAIGQGSSSSVYAAEDRLLGEQGHPSEVAIKVFHLSEEDTAGFDRILGEARRARSVEHPNVVRMLDFGRFDGGVFIVQELVRGRPLDAWIQDAGSNTRRIVAVVGQICKALEAVHGAGLVHRDLKPANVIINGDDVTRLVDFGTSRKQVGPDGYPPRSEAHLIHGTLAFMAPEQFCGGAGDGAPGADIYSAGALLYWALTGESPNGDSALDAAATLSGNDQSEDELKRALRARKLPRSLVQVVCRALAYSPTQRYRSAGALAADLEDWLRHRPIRWQRTGWVGRFGLAARRHPVGFGLIALCILLLVSGAVGWVRAVASARLALERGHAVELEAAKVQAEKAWKSRSAEKLGGVLMGFRARSLGLESEVLTSLWILEWVHGPVLLETPELVEKLWTSRITVLETFVSNLQRQGQGSSVTAQLVAPSLGLWYLNAGRPVDAERVLGAADAYWTPRVESGDPWIDEIRVMRSAGRLMLALDAQPAEASGDAARNEIAILHQALAGKPAGKSATQIRRLVSRLLARADSLNAP